MVKDNTVKKQPLTKKQFEALLTKAAQPVSEWNKPAPAKKQTKVVRPSGGYSGKHKNRGKTVNKEDLPNG